MLMLFVVGLLFGQTDYSMNAGQRTMQNLMINNAGDPALTIAAEAVGRIGFVNKFGNAPAGLQDVTTDIWDRADATPTQSVWLAPTAARVHAIVSGSASDAAAAGILTLGANITDGSTVTIGAKVYTFEAELTNVDGNVHIGADASGTIDNFIAAINLTATAGTDYALAMTANAITTLATIEAGDVMNIYMNTADGTTATTEDDDNAAWGAATIALGVGARTIRIYGLKTWDLAETSEDIYLQGVFSQNTANSYVIIHRMKVLTKGATNVNVGAIIATAASDATITAAILAGNGQTQMAIYGVPSIQTAYMTGYYASFNKTGAAGNFATTYLLVNPEPQDEPVNFLVKHIMSIQSNGSSYLNHKFYPYKKIEGPAIIKLNAISSADDIDGSGGFDIILIDN